MRRLRRESPQSAHTRGTRVCATRLECIRKVRVYRPSRIPTPLAGWRWVGWVVARVMYHRSICRTILSRDQCAAVPSYTVSREKVTHRSSQLASSLRAIYDRTVLLSATHFRFCPSQLKLVLDFATPEELNLIELNWATFNVPPNTL